jgi:hypothetical protein
MLTAPERLGAHHPLDHFDSGVVSLDGWLKRRAMANQASGPSRTYVVCDDGVVVGYYALASHAVAAVAATGRVRRNMPDPVPVVALGRLAVLRTHQGKRLGQMRVVLSTYGSRGDVEPMAGLAVQLRTLGAEVRVCAPPDCAELLARVGVPLVPIGVWR